MNNDKENLNNNNFEEIFQKIFIDCSDENFYDFSQKIFVNNSNEKILFSLTCLISINTSLFLIYLCIVALNFKIRTIYEYDSEIDNNKENSFDLFQKFYSAFFTKLLCPLEKDKVLKISFTNNNFDSEIIKATDEILTQKLQNFEIIAFKLKKGIKEKVIINIKYFIEKTLNFQTMEEVQKIIKSLSNNANNFNFSYINQDNKIKDLEDRTKEISEAYKKEIKEKENEHKKDMKTMLEAHKEEIKQKEKEYKRDIKEKEEILKKEAKEREEMLKKEAKEREDEHKKEAKEREEMLKKEAKEKEEEHKKEVEILKKEA